MEWLIVDITAVESPVRAKSAVFSIVFDVYRQTWATFFVTKEPLCDLETPS